MKVTFNKATGITKIEMNRLETGQFLCSSAAVETVQSAVNDAIHFINPSVNRICQKCGSPLTLAPSYCTDETCPYSSKSQTMDSRKF